jgi:hypothetical protein
MAGTDDLAPRRLVLHIDDLETLRRLAGAPRLPADFRAVPRPDLAAQPSAPDDPGGAPAAGDTDRLPALVERGLVVEDPEQPDGWVVHPSIAADLAVLAAPELLLETRVAAGDDELRAAHAVAGPLGASLVRAEVGAGVELSVFPAQRLGREVARVVPVARTGSVPPPTGIVPLAALVELPIAAQLGGPEVVAEIAGALAISGDQRELALELARRATGVLQVLLTAPARSPEGAAAVGEVLWYATDGGWVGLAPQPGDDGRAVARLRAVEPSALPGWLAPIVGQALLEVAR